MEYREQDFPPRQGMQLGKGKKFSLFLFVPFEFCVVPEVPLEKKIILNNKNHLWGFKINTLIK